ncbi:UNVERIFIED_CONTAM: hypothetical protein H355_004755 [Colinus virginianus]|nr:hypothetical protein H355_004755 [Colinus virginianus]
MWLKSQILLLYCIISEVWMTKRLDARRNLTKELYPLEDSGSAKWNRLKRSLYQGKFCRIRGCCTGRNDDCSFDIASRAAICYCDQFCASGPPGPIDCCADYWDACENVIEPTRSDEPWPPPASGVAADRITIHSDGQITDNLSVQNLISCDTRNQHGCNGGNVDGAWRYLKTHGVVSYACYPSFWKHHVDSPSENHCYVSSEYGKNHTNGPCPNALEDSNRLYRCGSHYRVSSKETDIMEEIMAKGPVQAIMKVYEDFFLYKEGIYRYSYKAGSKWKTHSVKLLGLLQIHGENTGEKMAILGFYVDKMNVILRS